MQQVAQVRTARYGIVIATDRFATEHYRSIVFARWRQHVSLSNTRYSGPITRVCPFTNGVSIGAAVSAGISTQTDRQTDGRTDTQTHRRTDAQTHIPRYVKTNLSVAVLASNPHIFPTSHGLNYGIKWHEIHRILTRIIFGQDFSFSVDSTAKLTTLQHTRTHTHTHLVGCQFLLASRLH